MFLSEFLFLFFLIYLFIFLFSYPGIRAMLAAYYRLGHAIWTLEITLVQSWAHTEETPTEATVQHTHTPLPQIMW